MLGRQLLGLLFNYSGRGTYGQATPGLLNAWKSEGEAKEEAEERLARPRRKRGGNGRGRGRGHGEVKDININIYYQNILQFKASRESASKNYTTQNSTTDREPGGT